MTESQRPAVAKIENASRWSWLDLFKVITATTALGGVLLHFVGHESQLTYLQRLVVDPGPFYKSPDQSIIIGYKALATALAQGFIALPDIDWLTPGVIGLIGVAVLSFALAGFLVPVREFAMKRLFSPLVSALEGPHRWRRLGASSLFAITATLVSVGVVVFAYANVVFIMSVVWVFGAHDGALRAAEVHQRPSGCSNEGPWRCISVYNDKEQVARGYLLDSSDKHIALFDVDLSTSRVLPRDGLEVRQFRRGRVVPAPP